MDGQHPVTLLADEICSGKTRLNLVEAIHVFETCEPVGTASLRITVSVRRDQRIRGPSRRMLVSYFDTRLLYPNPASSIYARNQART